MPNVTTVKRMDDDDQEALLYPRTTGIVADGISIPK